MAKKSSASQSRGGTTKKKTSSSRATSAKKKTTTRKRAATSKKKTTAKKVTPKKKTSAKKSSGQKSGASAKAATKKPTSKKKTTAKKVTSKKKSTAKKAPTAKKGKSGSKASSNGDASTAKGAAKASGATLGAAQEAARRLAAAAGLVPLKDRSTTAEEKSTKARRVRRSPLKPAQLEEFRLILLQKRAEVLSDVTEMENEALGGRSGALSSFPQHLADQGSDEYDQSLALGLAASQRKLLAEIDAALDRIENGTFGICESLGIPISRQRLEAQPWTRVSLEGARQQDSYTAR